MKYLLIILLLVSCSTEKQCQRHLRKAEALGCISYKSDTIVLRDTIKGFTIDTFVQYHQEIDTLIVDSGGVKVITVIKWKTKEIGQKVSKKDSVIKYFQITKHHNHTKIINRVPWWYWILPIVLLILLTLTIIKK
jgi:hypothetical protein